MSRHYKPTATEAAARRAARRRIIQAANRYAVEHGARRAAPYSARHIERCVGIVRRFGLVPDAVITTAGYNPDRRPRALRQVPARTRVRRWSGRRGK